MTPAERFARAESSRRSRVAVDVTTERRPMPTLARPTFANRGFGCVKVNDDGRTSVLRSNMTFQDAEAVAGRLRDELSESDVAAGWNVLPLRVTPGKHHPNDWTVRNPKTKGRPGVPWSDARRAAHGRRK